MHLSCRLTLQFYIFFIINFDVSHLILHCIYMIFILKCTITHLFMVLRLCCIMPVIPIIELLITTGVYISFDPCHLYLFKIYEQKVFVFICIQRLQVQFSCINILH